MDPELTESINEAMAPHLTEMRTIRDEISDTHTRLMAEAEKGERHDSEHVRQLEDDKARLEDELRLTRTQATLPGKSERAAFDGVLIRDRNELRDRLRRLRFSDISEDGESRSIDSSLFATGGALPPETADAFLDFVIEQQATLSRVTLRRMMSPTGHIDELTLGRRKLRLATEGVAPTNKAEGIGTKRRTLTTVETIWPEDISQTFLEDNIERANAETHIARMLATGFGNDQNDLAWNGDSASADDFLKVNDGWLKLMGADADVNDIDATGLDPRAVFAAMIRGLPVEFLGRLDLSYFGPVPFAQEYAEGVSARETNLGDAVLTDGFPALRYFGIPVVPEPALTGKAVLSPTANLVWGVQRSMQFEGEWRPRKRAVEYTITARTDAEYATGKAIVLADNLGATE